MDAVLNTVGPILLLIGIGYLATRQGKLRSDSGTVLCQYLFYYSLPFLTFSNIYTTEISGLSNGKFVLAYFLTLAVTFVLGMLLFRQAFGLTGPRLVLQVMGSYYGNTTYVGIPVGMMLFGSAIPALLTLLVQVIVFLPLTTTILDIQLSGKTSLSVGQIVKIVVRNPLLIATALAIACKVGGVTVPEFLLRSFDLLARPAMTVGLFSLGFTCYMPDVTGFTKRQLVSSLTASIIKVGLQPVGAYLIGRYLFALDPWWLKALVISAGMPCAVNAFVISQRYGVAENESKLSLLGSMIGFMISITVYLLVLG